MKICMIVEDYPPNSGGGGIFVEEISKILVKDGMEIAVFTSAYKNKNKLENRDDVKIYRNGNNRINYFFSTIKNLLSQSEYELYHGHGTFCGLIAKIVGTIKKRPVILHLHGYRTENMGKIKYLIQNFIIKLGYTRLVSSDNYGLAQAKKMGIDEKKAIQINGGVDLDKFKPTKSEKPDKNRLLFVGRLTKVKNLEFLIDAMAKVDNKETELLIIGYGELKKDLEKLIKDNDIKNIKLFTNVQREYMPEEYSKASFLILPSISEGQPLVILESLASGTPIIVSDIPSLKEMVDSSNAGYVFKSNDIESLVYKINNAINISNERYMTLSKNAREYAEAKFSWDKTANQIKEIYVGLSDARKNS